MLTPSAFMGTLLVVAGLLLVQDDTEALRAAFDQWQAAKQEFVKAWQEAQKQGKTGKGTMPDDVKKLQQAAEGLRDQFLAEAKGRLPAAAYDWRAMAHEDVRDYKAAADDLEKFIASLKAGSDEHRNALYRISLAALNSKNPERAVKWMRVLIDAEKDVAKEKRVGDFVRTALYPRELAELGRYDELIAFADEIEKDAPAGAMQARFLGTMGLKRTEAAEKIVDAVLEKRDAFPDLQGWAVQCKTAFLVGRLKHDNARALMEDYLRTDATNASAVEKNHRTYVAAAAAMLGKAPPEVLVDHWIGAEKDPGAKPLEAWKGNVVLLDFWQSW